MPQIHLEYPYWFIALCAVLAFIYAFILYRKHPLFKDPKRGQKIANWGLSILRFFTVFFLSFLLLSPFLRTKSTEIEKPILIFGHDNSESINNHFKLQDSTEYANSYSNLIAGLAEDYELKQFTFGDGVTESDSLGLADKTSNLAAYLDEVYDQYANQNIGAIVLASDGIYNEGNNPVYSGMKLNVPVFTIGLGDTIPQRDLSIQKVYYNKIAYLGDKFSIQVDVSAINCEGESTTLTVEHKTAGTRVFSKTLRPKGKKWFSSEEVIIDANAAGIQHYRIQATRVSNEATTINNVKDIYVDVLDSRQQILILANSPHPDLSVLKSAVETNKNYEANIAFAKTFTRSIRDFDIVILHQLPSKLNNINIITKQIKDYKIPALFILGEQSDIPAFNLAQSVLKVEGSKSSPNQVTPGIEGNFQLFTLNPKIQSTLKNFPPLNAPFGTYKLSPQASLFAKQQIGSVKTDYALIAFMDDINTKAGVISGNGLWRWRLYDYQEHASHELFDELIAKSITWLSVKNDKRKFRTFASKNIYLENERISIDAELYNDSYELINTPDANLVVKDSEGKEFPFAFSKTANAYTIDAGFFPVGSYSFTGRTSFGGQTLSSDGKFSVSPIQIESSRTTADHNLLRQLSEKYGGEFVAAQQLANIDSFIRSKETVKPIMYDSYETSSVINLKWLFPLLLFFLALEWLIRKWQGGY